MFFKLLTRAIAAIFPQNEYILPRWDPGALQRPTTHLQEIIIHMGANAPRMFVRTW